VTFSVGLLVTDTKRGVLCQSSRGLKGSKSEKSWSVREVVVSSREVVSISGVSVLEWVNVVWGVNNIEEDPMRSSSQLFTCTHSLNRVSAKKSVPLNRERSIFVPYGVACSDTTDETKGEE